MKSQIWRTSFDCPPCLWVLGLLLIAFIASGQSPTPTITNTNSIATAASSEDADKAWKELQKASRPPLPPAEWQGHPTAEQIKEFHAKQATAAEEAAEKAKQFYTKFPNHPKAAEARKKELDMLRIAEQRGSTNSSV